MRIGFDAKQAFYNRSGLGHYSRNTIRLLCKHYPENEYFLYTTDEANPIFSIELPNVNVFIPKTLAGKVFPTYWRNYRLTSELKADKIDIYHGLANELPFYIHRSPIKSVVTIHDLVFIRYPQLYKNLERRLIAKRIKYSCQIADKVVSVSRQTKSDLVNYFNIDPDKIQVVYQGCNPLYRSMIDAEVKSMVKYKYDLPNDYILSVGTIEERKNLMSIVKAIQKGKIDISLVVIGKPTPYLKKVQEYISENNLKYIYFIENVPSLDLRAIYQMAKAFVYPSVFEGFGIPILEALNSRVPVITSKGGCFGEAGGNSSFYIDPNNVDELIDALNKVLTDHELRKKMIDDGVLWADNFSEDKITTNLMNVYTYLVK